MGIKLWLISTELLEFDHVVTFYYRVKMKSLFEMLGFSDQNTFNATIDSEANSTQIPRRQRVPHQIAQRLEAEAPGFPAVAPVENSMSFNVFHECSEPLGNEGSTCSNCKVCKCHNLSEK